jgi:DNA topoisomerase-1
MEKKGIGRPSTYAATLSTIQKRGYVERINKRFHPTELGETVDSFLVKHLPDIIDVSFTARMEEDLDKIAQGDAERDAILKDFYRKLHNDLKDLREQTAGKTPIITDIKCPQCSKPLAIRFGKGGQFLGCTGFPDCSETSNFTRDEKGEITLVKTEGPVTLDETCPQCSKALVKRVGRYGPFVSCSGYPDCKYIKQDKLDHPCPSCGKEIVKRAWRKGTFWGCSGYPKCRVAAFGEIVEAECPSCKAPLMAEGAAGKRTCPVPTCPSNANRVTKSAKSTSKRSKNPQRLKKKDS